MKKLVDMTPQERRDFTVMGVTISTSLLRNPAPPGMRRTDHLAMICLLMKTYDRPLRNAVVEFDAGRAEFVRDAIHMATTYMENVMTMAEDRGIADDAMRYSHVTSMVFMEDPRFAALLERYVDICIRRGE